MTVSVVTKSKSRIIPLLTHFFPNEAEITNMFKKIFVFFGGGAGVDSSFFLKKYGNSTND